VARRRDRSRSGAGGRLLSDLLDSASRLAPTDVLDGAVATVADQLGATRAAIWTLDHSDGSLSVAACAGAALDPALATVAPGQGLVGRVARSRSPLHEAEHADEAERASWSAYPLMAQGQVVGVLGVWHESRMGELESELLAHVAEATAIAAERREVQRQTTEVVASLNEIGRSLVAELDLDRLLEMVVSAATRLTGAELGWLLSDEAEQAPPGATTSQSHLAVPVVGPTGAPIGTLHVGHPEPARFSETDERLLEGIAGYAAIGVENARRFAAEQAIALTLQRALLPDLDSAALGAELAVRYLPATARAEVGGDWYDAVALPDGSLAVTVGDVEGHSIEAAARMGTVRTAVAVFARQAADPAEVLRHVDTHLSDTDVPGMVTAVHATFDPATGLLRYARAGHPPPLLLRAGGGATVLAGGRGAILGFGLYEGDHTDEVTLAPGDTLVVFTDGLVERPGRSIDDGIERLRASLDGCALPSCEAVCDRILAVALDDHPGRDDIAILALRPS
jgi:GAF domain-containing protein